MGKNKKLFRWKKWLFLCLLVGVIFWGPKIKNEREEGFWQIGERIAKEYLLKRILYSQSIVWGFVEDMETQLWHKKQVMAVESFLDLEIHNAILSAEKSLEAKVKEENQAATGENQEEFVFSEEIPFSPVKEKKIEYDMTKYASLEELIKQFYIVDPTAGVREELFEVNTLKDFDCSIDKSVEGPQILLYHTHSQEAFANSEAGKEEDTILGAGEVLASYLEEYGFKVYHHKGKYDLEKRDYAYSESLPEIQKILQDNPSIQVVLDLHRDAVAEDTRLVTEVQGKQMAKVMFFNGLSRSAKMGDISYLENPYLQENLAFSFQMKLTCDEYYPGFARSIYLRAYRYNMHLCPKTLLIELGAQTNTVEEIREALGPLAHVLSMVLD